jgi:hypothetical protein
MRLFLQIDISNWQQRGYNKPFSRYAPSLASDLLAADVDNESDVTVVDLVIRLVDQAEKVFVLIYAQPEVPLGSSSKLLNHFFLTENKIQVIVLSGKNEMTEKMVKPFGEKLRREDDVEKMKKLIEEFALKKD